MCFVEQYEKKVVVTDTKLDALEKRQDAIQVDIRDIRSDLSGLRKDLLSITFRPVIYAGAGGIVGGVVAGLAWVLLNGSVQ